ncbi:MAG TPA: hypothetical protein VLG27_00445, partial [Candidatus Saccharimonadia bacterium]|nr:hypothetical protein [Candidatus Saccharimonadia bacterium]
MNRLTNLSRKAVIIGATATFVGAALVPASSLALGANYGARNNAKPATAASEAGPFCNKLST